MSQTHSVENYDPAEVRAFLERVAEELSELQKQTADLIEQAIRHPGSSLLTILQPFPTYNELHEQVSRLANALKDRGVKKGLRSSR